MMIMHQSLVLVLCHRWHVAYDRQCAMRLISNVETGPAKRVLHNESVLTLVQLYVFLACCFEEVCSTVMVCICWHMYVRKRLSAV